MVIIILVRVLNLAVPIVYKDVIDRMSAATNSNHPPHGITPEPYDFKQVPATESDALYQRPMA